jgi:hypothetical protein
MAFNAKQNAAILALFGVIANETYGLEREALHATELVPMQSGIDEWIGSWGYKTVSEVGMAKFIADYADDLPPVGRFLNVKSIGIKTIGCSYSYSEVELMQYLMNGTNVSRDDATSARYFIDKKVDEVILVGDSEPGVTGLFNNENVTTVEVAANAAGTSTKIKDKSLDEIVATIQAMIDGAYALNKGAIVLDTIVLPHSAFAYIATKRVSDNDGTSILDYLKKVFAAEGIVEWVENRMLDTLGTGSSGRAVLYKKNPTILSYVLPIPFRQNEPQAHALHYKVPCYARVGGTVIKNLKGIVYADGV